MKDYTTRVELMAIPIVAVLFGIGAVLFIAGGRGRLGLGLRRPRGTGARGGTDRPLHEAAIRTRLRRRLRRRPHPHPRQTRRTGCS